MSSEFKANELLSFHRPFSLDSSWFMLKVKINGEWSEVIAAKMSAFLTVPCSWLEIKNDIIFLNKSCCMVMPESKTFIIGSSDYPNIKRV